MKKKQKGLSPVAILVVILAFVGGFLLYQNQYKQPSPSYTQTTDETANWKIYTSDSFFIKYPNGWYVYELKNYPYQGYPGVIDQTEVIVTTLSKFPKISAGDGSFDNYIGMNIIKTEDNITKPVGTKYPNGEEDTVEEVKIGGNVAYKITQPDKDTKWLIPSIKGGVIITVLERSSTSDYISKIDQIVSTFKSLIHKRSATLQVK